MRYITLVTLLAAASVSAAGDAWIEGLGTIGTGSGSGAVKMSTDAGVVVGSAYTDGSNFASLRPILWTRAGGTQQVVIDAGYDAARFTGVSGDGSVAVGQSRQPNSNWMGFLSTTTESFRPAIPTRYPAGITRDGNIVFGQADLLNATRAAIWTSAGGLVAFDTPSTYGSTIEAASSTGSVFVGHRFDASYKEGAALWTSSNIRTDLGKLAGGLESSATAVSADGTVVAGWSDSDNGQRAFRWTSASGMADLGVLAGYNASRATAISANGSFIVGWSYDSSTYAGAAFIWSDSFGMVSLSSYLMDGSVDLSGWSVFYQATDVSDDGRYVIGNGLYNGITQGFVAHIGATPVPEPSTYGLMLGGLALAGAAIRRRRSK